MSTDLWTARIVAKMIYPQRRVEGFIRPGVEAHARLLRALRANKVPLLALDLGFSPLSAFYAGEAFQRLWEKERARWAALRAEYAIVRRALEGAGIRDVLIKSVGMAPSFPYASDNTDILVAAEQGTLAKEVLLDLGYVELKNVEEPHKFLFRKFHLGTTASAIHLHEFVGWGTGFMDDESLLANARQAPDDPELWIPCAEDALLVTMAHAFYEDKAITLGDLWKVMHILRQGKLDWERAYRQARHRGWQEGLEVCLLLWAGLERLLYGEHSFPEALVRQARKRLPAYDRLYLGRALRADEERLSFPWRVSFLFSKGQYYRKVWRDGALSWPEKAGDALKHSWAGIRRRLPWKIQRSMLISLSGVDGSGKTAQAEMLQRAFGECGLAARVVWNRGGSSRLAERIIALVKPLLPKAKGLDLTGDTRQAKVARKSVWLRRPLLRWGWTALVVGDLLLQYGRKVAWPLLWGRVVICDRYAYDALVELAALGGPEVMGSWGAKLLLGLSPRPRLAYLLDVDPAVARARKPDEELSFLEAQADLYRQMAPTWGLRLVEANGELAACADALVHEVLSTYYGKTLERLNV